MPIATSFYLEVSAELLGLPGAWSAALLGPGACSQAAVVLAKSPGPGWMWHLGSQLTKQLSLMPAFTLRVEGGARLFLAESTDLVPTYEVTSQVRGGLCLCITSQRIEIILCLLPRHHPGTQ